MAKTTQAQKKPGLPGTVDIPMSPLWHMGWAAKGHKENLKVLQDAVDHLTRKAKKGQAFDDDEKEFLVEIYEALWWGGKYKGYPEAAKLANYYVNGDGEDLKIDAEVYSTSVIVQAVQAVMKKQIEADLKARPAEAAALTSTDARLLKRKDYLDLFGRRGKRKAGPDGYLVDNGVLLTEQDNKRLKNADNRFVLKSVSQGGSDGSIVTTWRVDSFYDFEPFAKGYVTHLPLGASKLLLPDGLSKHMVTIGIAKEFKYYAEWKETWKPGAAPPVGAGRSAAPGRRT